MKPNFALESIPEKIEFSQTRPDPQLPIKMCIIKARSMHIIRRLAGFDSVAIILTVGNLIGRRFASRWQVKFAGNESS
jgi:hypothetical protein